MPLSEICRLAEERLHVGRSRAALEARLHGHAPGVAEAVDLVAGVPAAAEVDAAPSFPLQRLGRRRDDRLPARRLVRHFLWRFDVYVCVYYIYIYIYIYIYVL